jgi:hypothetical protein
MRVYNVSAATPQGPAAIDEQAFLLGVEFHEAAMRAEDVVKDPEGAPIDALCPMLVCFAFAAELYLKSLLPMRCKQHELDKLYGKVERAVRDDIETAYLGLTGRNRDALRVDLQQFARAFAEWRYVFEGAGQQLHSNLLIAFAKAVYQTIRSRRPKWHARNDQDARIRQYNGNGSMTVFNVGGGTFLHVTDGTGTLNTPDA